MKKIAWALPSFLEGSGGHRTILQNAVYLARKYNCECHLYIENDGTYSSNDALRDRAQKLFGQCPRCSFILGYDISRDYDMYFATAWFTAKVIRDIKSEKPKIYFIQDFEAWFNPMGDGYLLACNSYTYGLLPISIGRWLAHMMRMKYKSPGQYFDFCADKSIYKYDKSIKREKAICFIYQPDKPRRCSYIGIEALGIVKALRPDVKIYLYGSKQKGNIWFEHTNLGIISLDKCNELYNKCIVGLCMSSSNPSRIPFEMMSAGLPVVDLYLENNLYDLPDDAVSLAHHTPESIAKALVELIDDEALRRQKSIAGQAFMADRDLEYGFEQFCSAMEHIVNKDMDKLPEIEIAYKNEAIISDRVLEGANFKFNESYDSSLIGKLKRNRYLRESKLAHKIWGIYKILRKG